MTEKKQLIGTPTRTRAILDTYGLSFKKSLGQNFLTEPKILQQIADAAELTPNDTVIEIGPGIGSLTEILAQQAGYVLALEIDQRLLPILDDTLADYDNVTVVHQDVLKADFQTLLHQYLPKAQNIKVVANLPYYITTPILMRLLASDIQWEQIVVLMQREVAERLTANPDTKAYGSLSIAVQFAMDVDITQIVPRTVFVPQPNVDSAVVRLKRKPEQRTLAISEKAFTRVVKGCFAKRRKSLWNNLLALYGKDEATRARLTAVLEQVEIQPNRRAEQLSIDDFIRLATALEQ